jgi:hypothetical protein
VSDTRTPIIRDVLCRRGHNSWVKQYGGAWRCYECHLEGQQRRDARRAAGVSRGRQKVHPRVARAIRSTAGGRRRKEGWRGDRWQRAKAAVPRDPKALAEQWDAQTNVYGVVICAVSGEAMLTDAKDHRDPRYAEPDRLRPELGYVRGNIRWVQKRFNQWKSDTPLEGLVLLGRYAERELQAGPPEGTK